MWMRVKRVAVWRFCAAAGRAGKKIVAADGIPELAMFFVLWVWVAPFLTFLGVHARALTSWLAALLFYSILWSIRQIRIKYNMISRLRLKSEMWWAREVGGGKITLKEDGLQYPS